MATAVQIPQESVTVIVDGHRTTFLPMGYALGCFEIQSRGRGMDYANVTVWPSTHQHRLTSGAPDKYLDLNMKGLWQQEAYVFLLEFGMTVEKVLASLSEKHTTPDYLPVCTYCEIAPVKRSHQKYCSEECKKKGMAWVRLQNKLAKENPRIRSRA